MAQLDNRFLHVLLVINGVASFAAALVLALVPPWIPALASVEVRPEQNFVVYLLSATELALATLCLVAVRSREVVAAKQAVIVLIVFHLASTVAGLAALSQATNMVIAGNVALRLVMIVMLTWSLHRMLNAGRRAR
jgi:hypothetical protein